MRIRYNPACGGNRAHAGAAAAVRNAEGFVQIHMQHVGAHFGRLHNAHLRIHIGTVHINLAAVFMNDAADVAYAFFIHAVRGRIGDHQRAQSVFKLSSFGF